jgi:MoaA/NifB/PqqE/SkfB family radical SAM enzyme
MDHGDFPLNLNVEVTTRCNLACTFCSHSSLTPEQLGDMPWERYVRLIDEGERHNMPTVNLNGLGEPLLVRNLPQVVVYAKQHGFIDVMFHTNGSVMSEPLALALIEAGLDRIIFSVDSPDKATYEAMRINGRWDRVMENVRTFAGVRNKLGRTVPLIRTTMVLTEATSRQVEDFVTMWKPFADQITLQDLTWRTKLLDRGLWKNRERTAVPVDLDLVREEAVRRRISFVCPYLYQSVYAFWNGDVIPCGNPNARKHMIMGQFDNATLHEIWHGQTYRELRTLHAEGRWYEHPVCRECEVPLIELYKVLGSEGEERFTGSPECSTRPAADPVPRLQVASELGTRDSSVVDLVTSFQNELAGSVSKEPASTLNQEQIPK